MCFEYFQFSSKIEDRIPLFISSLTPLKTGMSSIIIFALNFDCLQIINIEKPLEGLTLGNYIGRKIFMQLIDLDEEEYNFIKDYDDKIKQLTLVIKNNKPLPQLSVKKAKEDLETRYTEMRDAIHDGMFQTEKRKKFPINRYDSYIGWSEG